MVSSGLRVKSSSVIKPIEPTPTHRLWLSDLDRIQPVTHAPTVYFYRSNNNHDFFSPEIMKTALSRTLVHFYPLAGRLGYDQDGRLEIDCNEAGVIFYEAECDADMDVFGNFKPTPELRNLVPSIDYNTHISEWPLMMVQLTVFRCGGMCLGLGVCHTVSDGHSAIHLVSTWAMIAREGNLSDDGVKPFLDRTVLRARDPPVEPAFEHLEFKLPPRLIGREDDSEEQRKETVVEMLKLTAQQVEFIRCAANDGLDVGNMPRRYTRYEAVAAHVWFCTSKARGLDADQLTKLYIAVNCRARLRPPLPEGYLGNAATITAAVARYGDLNHIGQAASRIREAVEKMKDEYLRSAIDFLSGQQDLTPFKRGSHTQGWVQVGTTFYGCPNLTLTSWLGMNFYDADFGLGPPLHMGPAALGFEGKAYIVPTREDDGGIFIALRLQTDHMKAFKDLLYVMDGGHDSFV